MPRLAFEGEQVTPTQGEDYATHAPLTPVHLHSWASRDSAFSADRFSDAVSNSTEHHFGLRKQNQTERGQGELHEQWDLCEQQGSDCSKAGELLWATTRCDRAVPRRNLQFQQNPAGYVLTSRRRG
jgi:hypothetical protein